MTLPPAGSTRKGLLSRDDYLAPLPLPTGEQPSDCLNIIWRKNDVFLDIGCYSVGSAVMVMWPMLMMFLLLGIGLNDLDILWLGAAIMIIPVLMLIHGLFRPVPLPLRFNRQRREVCLLKSDGEYWIVPWETVTAAATRHTSISQAGTNSMGLLVIGLENPDPDAEEGNQHFSMGFNCGGGETAMALWECVRSYMEIGPQATPDCNFSLSKTNYNGRGVFWGVCCTYANGIRQHCVKGEFEKATWAIFCIFAFNAPLAFMLQEWKLAPPPDLNHPDITEWSKPLPAKQWAKRSPELEAAIARREAQLARSQQNQPAR